MDASDRLIAAALGGDAAALRGLAERDSGGALARRHRAGSALYLLASRAGVDGPALAAWRREMAAVAVQYALFEQVVARVAAALEAADVAWVPLKGYDLATRLYQHPEERATSDLDLLIAAADLEPGRQALLADGWREVSPGPLARRYLTEEGYAWQAVGEHGVLLELHFRLWGSVPEGLAAEMVAASTRDASLPAGGRRLTLSHAYLAAAVHAWLTTPPRAVTLWRDLERIAAAAPPSLAGEVAADARRWDLQLPVSMASEVAAELWDAGTCRRIAAELGDLRWPERLALAGARRRGTAQASLAALTAARLLAGRRSRHRFRAVWRRLWDHAGVVESATSPEWPWIARRFWYQASALGWRRPARWIESLSAPAAVTGPGADR